MSMDQVNMSMATTAATQAGFDKAAIAARGAKDESAIDATARDFEAMFVAEMLRPMFESIDIDPRFGGGKGEEVFRGQMIDEYGRMLAASGQMGIADTVKAQLLEMQEVAADGSVLIGDKAPIDFTTEEITDDPTSFR